LTLAHDPPKHAARFAPFVDRNGDCNARLQQEGTMRLTTISAAVILTAASTAVAGTGKQVYSIPAELPENTTVTFGLVQAVGSGAALATTFAVPTGNPGVTRYAGIYRINSDGTLDTDLAPDGVNISADATYLYGFDAGLGFLALVGVWGPLSGSGDHTWFQTWPDMEEGENDPIVDVAGMGRFGSVRHDLSNDRFVLGGATSTSQSIIVVTDANGDLDTTFNGTGYVTPGLPANFSTVGVSPDGSIVAMIVTWTYFQGSTIHLRRYSTSGSLLASSSTVVGFNQITDMIVDGSGRPLVLGAAYTGGSGRKASLRRFTTSLTADSTFGTGGVASYTVLAAPGASFCTACGTGYATVQSSGKIVFAGYRENNASLVVARVNSNGTLDTTFGTSGARYVTIADAPLYDGGSIDLGSSDSLLVSGGALQAGYADRELVVAKLTASGALDTSFGATP
jgi:uncharacterized delta-60 repeat protein